VASSLVQTSARVTPLFESSSSTSIAGLGRAVGSTTFSRVLLSCAQWFSAALTVSRACHLALVGASSPHLLLIQAWESRLTSQRRRWQTLMSGQQTT
jgi:hypothetical protein